MIPVPAKDSGESTARDAARVGISVVSPYYRAADCLPELYRRLVAAIEPITKDFEIVLVDDCSPDDGWRVIQELARKDPRVRGVRLARNFGQHHAITAGLVQSRGDWVVVMDCDLQDRPEEIPRLYAKAQEGHHCVMARRVHRADSALKRLRSWSFYKVFNFLTDLDYDGTVGNFSIISRQVVEQINSLHEAIRFYPGFLVWLGYRDAFVDVQHDPRFAGTTSYSWKKLFKFASEIVFAHSTRPLKLTVGFGLSVSAFSFLAGLFYLVRVLLYGSSVSGWPSLIISLMFSTGTIISTLGVVGLYVGRVFTEVKRRPLFVVRARTFE